MGVTSDQVIEDAEVTAPLISLHLREDTAGREQPSGNSGGES